MFNIMAVAMDERAEFLTTHFVFPGFSRIVEGNVVSLRTKHDLLYLLGAKPEEIQAEVGELEAEIEMLVMGAREDSDSGLQQMRNYKGFLEDYLDAINP